MGGKELEYSSHQQFIKVKWPSGSEDVYHSIFCGSLPDDIIQNAMQEVKETEENKAEGIRNLRKFMEKKRLTCSDDEVLLSVLRNCKYDVKKSESKLESFLKVRQMVGTWLAAIGMKDLEAIMDEMGTGLFPYRDTHGRIIIFTRSFDNITFYEPDFLSISLIAELLFCLSLPMTSLLGITYIAESDYTSMKISIPLRIRRVDVVKGHFAVQWLYNVLKPILPRKIASRVSFLGEGYENLCKHYHPDILPTEFGGNLGPLSDMHCRKKFFNFVQKLKAEYDYVTH